MKLYDHYVFILFWSGGLLILDQGEHIYALLMRCLTYIKECKYSLSYTCSLA